MKISTQDGLTQRWSKPIFIKEVVWFIGCNWGYAYDINGKPIVSIEKDETKGIASRYWARITEIEIQPSYREVEASTGG